MQTSRQPINRRRGLTLLEMTIVILVLMTLISAGFFTYRQVDEWKLGRAASETLRQVHTAQRMFLADNPTRLVSSIAAADIIPYMPGNATALPTVKSLNGTQYGILVNVSPPVINAGSGVVYDPSGNNRDSLWDIGE